VALRKPVSRCRERFAFSDSSNRVADEVMSARMLA
jgi:hypothetical protein